MSDKNTDDSLQDRLRRELDEVLEEYDADKKLEDAKRQFFKRVVDNRDKSGSVDDLLGDADEMFDDLFDDSGGADDSHTHSRRHVEDGYVHIVTDLPGYYEDEVDLRVDNDGQTVRVNAESQDNHRETVSRVFELENEVDLDGCEATLERGVLTVQLPLQDEDSDRTTISLN